MRLTETESRRVDARNWGEGLVCNRDRVSDCEDETVLLI